MSRYGFEESIRDGATLKLHFEPRLVDLHIDKAAIDQAYAELTGELSDLDKDNLAKAASKMAVLVKVPERVEAICADIARTTRKVAPNGFKGMVVTFDQECCLLYKAALDQHPAAEASEIVISASGKERDERFKPYARPRRGGEAARPLPRRQRSRSILVIVTAKLLTGFDAPILQAMYLDKPLRDHTLLAGHLPHQPHLRRQEDARPHRRLPRRVRRRGQGAGVRRGGLPRVVGNIEGLKVPSCPRPCRSASPSSPASTARRPATRG
jgi:type I restriction enzyme R subunit